MTSFSIFSNVKWETRSFFSMPKIKIKHLKKNYAHKDWLKNAVEAESSLDYFSFANYFKKNEAETNTHYSNLLSFLLNKNQSKTLRNMATDAQNIFAASIQ